MGKERGGRLVERPESLRIIGIELKKLLKKPLGNLACR
jgi:hypothetical protein